MHHPNQPPSTTSRVNLDIPKYQLLSTLLPSNLISTQNGHRQIDVSTETQVTKILEISFSPSILVSAELLRPKVKPGVVELEIRRPVKLDRRLSVVSLRASFSYSANRTTPFRPTTEGFTKSSEPTGNSSCFPEASQRKVCNTKHSTGLPETHSDKRLF